MDCLQRFGQSKETTRNSALPCGYLTVGSVTKQGLMRQEEGVITRTWREKRRRALERTALQEL